MHLRNIAPVAISVAPGEFYTPDVKPAVGLPGIKPDKTPGQVTAAIYASLPRAQRRKIDRDAKRALRKYRKAKPAAPGYVVIRTPTTTDPVYECTTANGEKIRGTRSELQAMGITFTGGI